MTMKTDLLGKVGDNQDTKSTEPYELVGAGNWTVEIWKLRTANGEWSYELRFRNENYGPQDLFDLPKLTQVLASFVADDGCVDEQTSRGLSVLANDVDWLANEYSGDVEGAMRELRRMPRKLACWEVREYMPAVDDEFSQPGMCNECGRNKLDTWHWLICIVEQILRRIWEELWFLRYRLSRAWEGRTDKE